MAGKKKRTSGKKAKKVSGGTSAGFLSAYVKLRTLLDAVESGGLRYTLSGDSADEQIKRANKLAEKLSPVAKQIKKWMAEERPAARAMAETSSDGDPCPDGYYFCGGMCIPFPCPPDVDK